MLQLDPVSQTMVGFIPACSERDCALYSPFAVCKCGMCQEEEIRHEKALRAFRQRWLH